MNKDIGSPALRLFEVPKGTGISSVLVLLVFAAGALFAIIFALPGVMGKILTKELKKQPILNIRY